MQYMLLLYGNEAMAAAMGEAEMGAVLAEFGAAVGELAASGKLRGTSPLHPTASATTVRVRDGHRTLTDGPFAETKEQLGGYFLIEAADLDEAIAISERLPTARYGSVEIRPIMKIPGA